jgi:hypothetical protein
MRFRVRRAEPGDAEAIARIYNQGIEERLATFETRPRTPDEVRSWLEDVVPAVVAVQDDEVVAWAAAHRIDPAATCIGAWGSSPSTSTETPAAGAPGVRSWKPCSKNAGTADPGSCWPGCFRRTRPVGVSVPHSGSGRSASIGGMPAWMVSGGTA